MLFKLCVRLLQLTDLQEMDFVASMPERDPASLAALEALLDESDPSEDSTAQGSVTVLDTHADAALSCA